jgi:dimethylargininase
MVEPVAITRDVSPAIGNCELTHLARVPIDLPTARAQHALYKDALRRAGYGIEELPSGPEMPDAVFVEDIALVFDELAVITRPGAASRRAEVPAVVEAVGRYRDLRFIEPPATLDGGDVLVAGRRVFVGCSSRTSAEGVGQLRRMLIPHGYSVCQVAVADCLHLKSAVTSLGDDVLLMNPDWIEPALFSPFDIVAIDPREPAAANALRLRDRVLFPSAFPRTADRLAVRGLRVEMVDAGELAKAEGAVTCCSILIARGRG